MNHDVGKIKKIMSREYFEIVVKAQAWLLRLSYLFSKLDFSSIGSSEKEVYEAI